MKVIHIYGTVLQILNCNLFPYWGHAIWDSLVSLGGGGRSATREVQDVGGNQQDCMKYSLAEKEFSTLGGEKAFLIYKCSESMF